MTRDRYGLQNASMRALAAALLAAPEAQAESRPTRVKLTGEIIDSWCQISGIMGVGTGTPHHQSAIWCAVGGVPIGIQGSDGNRLHIASSGSGEPIHSDFQYLMRRDGKPLSVIVPNATAEEIAARLRRYAANGQG